MREHTRAESAQWDRTVDQLSPEERAAWEAQWPDDGQPEPHPEHDKGLVVGREQGRHWGHLDATQYLAAARDSAQGAEAYRLLSAVHDGWLASRGITPAKTTEHVID